MDTPENTPKGKPGRKPKLTAAQVVEALRMSHGLKTVAAENLGVAFETLEKYIGRSAEAQAIVNFWRKLRKDRAEFKLDEAIERGDAWAIMFTLKNARDREYSDRLDVTAKVETVEAYDYGASIAPILSPVAQSEHEQHETETGEG